MADIHPTAVVASGAELADDVEIGPYCVVGNHARLDGGTRLMAHVYIDGWTTIGRDCVFFPFSSVGCRTQDLKFKGGKPRLEIGARTTVRESVTLHTATADGDVTRVGSDCLLMAYSHVAHDCEIGDHVIMANCCTLAGHVVVAQHAIIGGLSGVHQFVRIGRHAIVGGCSKVTQDVPPFMMADGHPLAIRGVNTVGLKRRAFSAETIRALKEAYRILYRGELTTSQGVEKVRSTLPPSEEIEELLAFISASKRGVTH